MAKRVSKARRRRGDLRRRTLECGTVAVKSLRALPAGFFSNEASSPLISTR